MNDNYIEWYNHINEISQQIITILNQTPISSNSTIIFDIDGTLIHSSGEGPIIPIVNVWNHAKSMGITLVIITNRIGTQQNINYTQIQLDSFNISGWRLMFFRPPDKVDNPFKYKGAARTGVYERGYNTIISIGDQPCDIGNYGGIGVLIPVLK